jgi:hypothetical protein
MGITSFISPYPAQSGGQVIFQPTLAGLSPSQGTMSYRDYLPSISFSRDFIPRQIRKQLFLPSQLQRSAGRIGHGQTVMGMKISFCQSSQRNTGTDDPEFSKVREHRWQSPEHVSLLYDLAGRPS